MATQRMQSGMRCPACGAAMTHYETEDEGSGDVLFPVAYWACGECPKYIHDWEDEYEEPPA